MGVKTEVKYLAKSGKIHLVSLSPERAAAAGAEATGTEVSDIRAKVSKSRKEYGIKPRGVTLMRIIGTGDETFRKYSFLPVLTPTAFDGTGFKLGSEVVIDSVKWSVVSRSDEDY